MACGVSIRFGYLLLGALLLTFCHGDLDVDRETLLTLYDTMGGPYWQHNDGWATNDDDMDTWSFVSVEGEFVVSVLLALNNLTGEIPPDIGNFTGIQVLKLDGNSLTGSIPTEIGNLVTLENLYLASNSLTGSIPPEICNLGSLANLFLFSNELEGELPPELGKMVNLGLLNAHHNNMTGKIPVEYGNLTSLRYLALNDNLLTGEIPEGIGTLAAEYKLGNENLTGAVYLQNNYLNGTVPAGLNEDNVPALDLSNNLLTDWPNQRDEALVSSDETPAPLSYPDQHGSGSAPFFDTPIPTPSPLPAMHGSNSAPFFDTPEPTRLVDRSVSPAAFEEHYSPSSSSLSSSTVLAIAAAVAGGAAVVAALVCCVLWRRRGKKPASVTVLPTSGIEKSHSPRQARNMNGWGGAGAVDCSADGSNQRGLEPPVVPHGSARGSGSAKAALPPPGGMAPSSRQETRLSPSYIDLSYPHFDAGDDSYRYDNLAAAGHRGNPQPQAAASPLPPRAGSLPAGESTTSSGTASSGETMEEGAAASALQIATAVMGAAEGLAQQSFIPGVREAAAVVAGLVRLAVDHKRNPAEIQRRLRWCRSIVLTLERAGEVLGSAVGENGEAERFLLEDVRESIEDMVQVMQSYKNKNAVSKVLVSTLCKRRQEEAEASIDAAMHRLQLGLQVRVGRKLEAVGQAVEEGLQHQQRVSQESRIRRRKKRLDQLEIPPGDVEITDEVLGKGGFGTVYLADFNGFNAAAKVVVFETGQDGDHHDDVHGEHGGKEVRTETRQRKAFMRELEAMKRLKGPHTVQTYGAVTSSTEHMVLVMELLPGGDLRTRLRRAREPLEESVLRGITLDVCAGMGFLHAKAFVHGDLKSANVLFDGTGRAKIADFGTSLWTQHTTRLATYTTKPGQSVGMSLPWAAPEVLNRESPSFKSDVYSFGVVLWECFTRLAPWHDVGSLEKLLLTVISGERPTIPADAPADLAAVARACWAQNPTERPVFEKILADFSSA